MQNDPSASRNFAISQFAQIVAPSHSEDDCFVQNIDSEETSIRFYPREEGIHGIHVKLDGVHIPGSPFRVKVGKDVAGGQLLTRITLDNAKHQIPTRISVQLQTHRLLEPRAPDSRMYNPAQRHTLKLIRATQDQVNSVASVVLRVAMRHDT